MKKGLFVLLAILISGCSEYTEPQESDIAVFERFLSEVTISSDKNTINVASLYQPQDKLFDAVLAIQRNHWSKAIKELTPYAEKKDPDALFWLAQISYGSNPTENIKAGKMMLESAQLGNPYAALMFSPNNITCQRYFSQYCDKKWVDKAKEIFSNQAKKGDIRAIFYTKKFKGNHDVYINAIIDAAKNNYYYPIVEYANNILKNKELNEDSKLLAYKLLKYAKHNNFIPAFNSLISYEMKNRDENSKELQALLSDGIVIGADSAWKRKMILTINDPSLSHYDKYVIAKAAYILNRDKLGISVIHTIQDRNKLNQANKKAQEIVDSIPEIIYIDGTHPMVD
ncbi:TPA: hypothetical protein ACX6SG_000649 [Photobacterium damselae]|uniref:hypothetical protein n=1 Tax=Photobacterium damselae TaxID=38293 RepID=UPI001EDCCB68|nr:hypothetical protein [Photobacterium damselae]MCG3814941.1 hypothetical protein [Photobacterium damselae]